MNKLKVTIAALLIACFGFGVVNAQDKTGATPAKQTPAKTSTKKAANPKATGTDAKPAADKAAKPAGPHLKKDGTPDKRYKENKTSAPASTDKPAAKKSSAKPAAKKSTTKKAADKKGM